VVQGPDPIGDGWPAGIRRGGRSAIGDGGRREDQPGRCRPAPAPAETSGSGPSGPPEVAGASAATPGGCSLCRCWLLQPVVRGGDTLPGPHAAAAAGDPVRRRGEKDRTAYPLGRCGREGGWEGFPAAPGDARPGSSSRNVTTARCCAGPRHSA